MMNKPALILALSATALLLGARAALAQPAETRSLIPAEGLTGWHADVPAADNNAKVAPSFALRDGMLVSMGKPEGHLLTDEIYQDYRLEVEYRFAAEPGNCGVLVHASTPRALYSMFPASIEVQMHHTNAGDFWCIAENIAVNDMASRRSGEPDTWGGEAKDSRRILNMTDGSENPAGEWNRMVIECLDDRVRAWVNGNLVNDGFGCTASEGHIALQAEGVEVEFRRVDLTPITELSPATDRADALAANADAPVRVFILAGQSNMEGKAQLKLLDHQITAPATADLFAHLHKGGEYLVRNDVWINYHDRRGGLTVGYGSPNRFGVELEFGNLVGNRFDEPVLLIKTAWGGKSLYRDFRPPSAGLPSEGTLEEILAKTNEGNSKNNRPEITIGDVRASYGRYYRDMMQDIDTTLDQMGSRFPHLEGREYEIAGFVWFQGWNDQYGGAEQEYKSNMEHFIRDVRADLDTPDLPFVIGVMGQNGSTPAKGPMLTIQEAQLAMEHVADFAGNVDAVRTDVLIDTAAEALFPDWKEQKEEWEKVGSDHPYHYLGSAVWFSRMGTAFGEAMLELMGE
jgi:hypothetical protein